MGNDTVLYMLLFTIIMLVSLILFTIWAIMAFVMHYVRKAKHFAHKYFGVAEALTSGTNFIIISPKKSRRKSGWS